MDCSLPGFSVHGIFQARILEWVVISSSRGLSQPRDPTCISCIGRHILYHWATWEAHEVSSYHFFPHLSVEDIKAQGSSITCPESCSLLCGWRVSIDPLLLLLLPSPAPTRRNQKEIEVRGQVWSFCRQWCVCCSGLSRPVLMGSVTIKSHLTMTCSWELHLLRRVLDISIYKEENQQGSTV